MRVLPTVGGQTALNLAVALAKRACWTKYGVELIGAQIDAIKVAEDRLLFKEAMQEIGLDVPRERPGPIAGRSAGRSSTTARLSR